MKRIVSVVVVACMLWVLSVPALAVSTVSIGQIVLDNQAAITQVEEAVRRALASQNLLVASSDADYRVNVYHKDTEHRRTFNWLIFLLPLWPIIGFTQSHTTVYVDSTAVDRSGNIAWQGSGQATASTIFFSDFRYPKEAPLLATAAERSVRGLGSLALTDFDDTVADNRVELGVLARF